MLKYSVDYANILNANPYALLGVRTGYRSKREWSAFVALNKHYASAVQVVVWPMPVLVILLGHSLQGKAFQCMVGLNCDGNIKLTRKLCNQFTHLLTDCLREPGLDNQFHIY